MKKEKGARWKKVYKQICDGDCLNCRYHDCLVPAITEQAVKVLTGGGVKDCFPFHSLDKCEQDRIIEKEEKNDRSFDR